MCEIYTGGVDASGDPIKVKLNPMSVFIGEDGVGKSKVLNAASKAGYHTLYCPENGIHRKFMKLEVERIRKQVPVAMITYCPYFLDWCTIDEIYVCRMFCNHPEVVHLGSVTGFKERLGDFTLGEFWSFNGEDGLISGLTEDEVESRSFDREVIIKLYESIALSSEVIVEKDVCYTGHIQFTLDRGKGTMDVSHHLTPGSFLVVYDKHRNAIRFMTEGNEAHLFRIEDPKSLTAEWFISNFLGVVRKELAVSRDRIDLAIGEISTFGLSCDEAVTIFRQLGLWKHE